MVDMGTDGKDTKKKEILSHSLIKQGEFQFQTIDLPLFTVIVSIKRRRCKSFKGLNIPGGTSGMVCTDL